MSSSYLVRFGFSRLVGRFLAEPPLDTPERGLPVVVRTSRGLELGEVLAVQPVPPDLPADLPRVLRPASGDDLGRGLRAESLRDAHFAACEAIFLAGAWPITLIDAEPLPDLDDQANRVILHYLGPHRLDAADLVAAIREASGLDIAFEPAGLDLDLDSNEPEPGPIDEPEPAGNCGSGGCGSCGSTGGGCGSSNKGGCGSCAVRSLAGRRPMAGA